MNCARSPFRPAGRLLSAGWVLALGSVLAGAAAKDKVDFNSQIRPVLSTKCFPCHGLDDGARKAKLRLDVRTQATQERDGIFPIKPGDLKNSEMIRRITSGDPEAVMPPPKTGHPLTPPEIDLLKKWVQQGAPYGGHWAFTRPERPVLPKIKNRSWPKNPVDRFILARLEGSGLKPSPPADRYALIRRLTLDVIGLPPTPAEVDAFVQDPSPNAYEKVVDRLLASPAYGEKWARMWLDLARYADSYGYGQDSLRANNPWPYRDWVINAFNRNLPFDQFTLEQIAGDLLEHPTEEQLVATAFHRNTMTNVEGGTDDEEWRVAAVKDRANVTLQAWMGLTMGCAQCHTHKFDPITQKEYYQFYAFFNQTEDNDQPDEQPVLPYPTKAEREMVARLKDEIAALQRQISVDDPAVAREFAEWDKLNHLAGTWQIVEPGEFESAKGTTFTKLADQSLLAGTNSPDKDTYTIKFASRLGQATALRLEVLPDDSLPAHGPGRTEGGKFVLNELGISWQAEGNPATRARFVRIELPGPERILSLAEVQVFHGGENLALTGHAAQSSVDYDGPPERAIDGNTNGDYEAAKSTTHTRAENDPWWEVDLGEEKALDSIVVWNRTGGEVGERLANFRLRALDAGRKPVWTTQVSSAPNPSTALKPDDKVVQFKRATATFNQSGFEVAKLAEKNPKSKEGWAIGGSDGKAQTAIFELTEPLPAGEVTVKLVQKFGERHTLGRFRLALTESTLPSVAPPARVDSLLALAPEKRSADQEQELRQWYQQYANATADLRRQIEPRQKELAAIKPALLPIMRDLPPDKRRVTHLLNKGNFLDPGEALSAGVPAAFHAWSAAMPTNRLGVAQWLMSPENPLTARVTANRIWAQMFGLGLVETEEDFGTQGALPSHPELLDWLALELQDHGWNLKELLKTIVLSATYQQSAQVTPELLQKDPHNRLLARAPRRRLDAEMIRDQALALSGLLSPKLGGASVYPPQPDGLWRVAFDGARAYPTSLGEDRYRRGLYTVWRRTVPYPSMTTFDAPSRESCTFRRLPTNTPLQAYVTLNDPVYVEAAQALGRRLVREGGTTVEERIRFGLKLVLARPPAAAQIADLKNLFESQLAHYRGVENEAIKLATDPLGSLPEGLGTAEAAAWTVVANVLLNLDGVLVKS